MLQIQTSRSLLLGRRRDGLKRHRQTIELQLHVSWMHVDVSNYAESRMNDCFVKGNLEIKELRDSPLKINSFLDLPISRTLPSTLDKQEPFTVVGCNLLPSKL